MSERFADLISGNADLVVCLAEEPRLSNLVARRLAPARWVVVVSPDYIGKHGVPLTPCDLLNFNCSVYDRPKGGDWRFKGRDGEQSIKVSGNLRSKVALLDGYALPESTLYAVFLPDRRLPERIRTFVQFLADRFSSEAYWQSGKVPA